MEFKRDKIVGFLFFSILILLDQLSKYIVRSKSGFYICNPNLAFGIKPSYFLVFIFSLVLILFLFQIKNIKQIKKLKYLFKNLDFENWNLFDICNFKFGTLVLIISGGISNIIDRLNFGCVIDFIKLPFWPAFNLADIYITLGVMLILISILRNNKNCKSI